MKKRFVLTACVLLIVVLCACVFVACNGNGDDKKSETYTVSYDLGAYQGEGIAPDSVKVEKDGKLNLPTADKLPAWEGHTFEGWKLNGEGELLAGGTEISVTADAKYVAQWIENDGSYPEMKAMMDKSGDTLDKLLYYLLYLYESGQAETEGVEGDSFYIYYITPFAEDSGLFDASFGYMLGITFSLELKNGESATIYCTICQDEEKAQQLYDSYKDYYEPEEIVLDGNVVVMEGSYERYQEAMKAEKVEGSSYFSDEMLALYMEKLHTCLKKGEAWAFLNIGLPGVQWYTTPANGNCESYELYNKIVDDDIHTDLYLVDMQRFFENNMSEGSFFDIDEENGYYHVKYTHKPGWHVGEVLQSRYDYENNKVVYFSTGKYYAEYYYNELPEEVTTPSNLAGVDIDRATIRIGTNNNSEVLNSLIVSDGAEEVEVYGNVKEITLPANDSLTMYSNEKLEKIHFAGSEAQWKEMYPNAGSWCVLSDYDEDDNPIETHITFTVECQGGKTLEYSVSEQRQFEAGSIYEALPEEELKHLIGYVYTMGKQNGYESSLIVPYTKDGMDDSSGVKLLGYLDIATSNGEDEAGGMIYFFKSEADAQANRDYWVSCEPEGYEESMKVVGNRIYFGYPSGEEWQAYYQNTILKAEIPQSLSETRLEYMLDTVSVAHGTSFVTMDLAVSTNYKYDPEATAESGESFSYSLGENDTNRDNIFAFCTVKEANDPTNDVYSGLENKITKYGEEGSSVNKQLENGFVFFRYIEKPGFRYELNSEGATLVKYCFDASSPASIVVPDKVEIDGNTVNVTIIGSNAFSECQMTSVTIPEGVKEIESYVFQNCSKLKTINLPQSLESVDYDWLLGCDSLETLNYAGTSTEWNAFAEKVNANSWCTYHDYDEDDNFVEKHISFTVVCSDGVSINYPTQTD